MTFADVTDRFRIESALRDRNEALVAADRLKSDFIHHASFLFRDPLNAVHGFADLLASGHAGPLTDKQKDYVARHHHRIGQAGRGHQRHSRSGDDRFRRHAAGTEPRRSLPIAESRGRAVAPACRKSRHRLPHRMPARCRHGHGRSEAHPPGRVQPVVQRLQIHAARRQHRARRDHRRRRRADLRRPTPGRESRRK